ncbi:MAG: RnfABCDGE type electron transport complex subunit D [Desulfobacterales bacterium]|nr:RnfABCDGE type electron transport complex subunit D [Desulfobacterales bacterium]
MSNQKKFIVSHAPFWHIGHKIPERNGHIMLATLPALLAGLYYYGIPALGVICLSVSSAMIWELAVNRVSKIPVTIGDGSSALIGLLFAMLLPAAVPWWLVIVGTFVAIIIGKQIFGGIGANPFNPTLLAFAMIALSWKDLVDFNEALVNYDLNFIMFYPLTALKFFGVTSVSSFDGLSLLLGRQSGGFGSTFGLGLILGGGYLMAKGVVRWEIAISFLAGIFVTALIFFVANPTKFAGPIFHLFSGYTLIGAFFLAPEDSSSPVNFYPMLIYGAGGGIFTVLIRNIGVHVDGVVFAILLMNIANPLVDKIRPKAFGKVVKNA